jgi:hypothetical protein
MSEGSALNPPIRPIPDPAGATQVGPWVLDDGQTRSFTGTRRSVAIGAEHRITIDIRGDQHRDGRVTRYIWLGGVVVTAVEARQVGRCLMSAGNELDRLSEADWYQTGRADA